MFCAREGICFVSDVPLPRVAMLQAMAGYFWEGGRGYRVKRGMVMKNALTSIERLR